MAEHGTYDGYVSGCRCRPCTAAAAHYQRRRRHWPTPNTPAAQRLASQSWRDQAACKGQPTEWWYPSGPDSTRQRVSRKLVNAPGIAICLTCPVRQHCADHAISTAEPDGIWGGLTPASRDAIAIRRHIARQLRDALDKLANKEAM